MPGFPINVQSHLNMSLDNISRSQRSDSTRYDKRPAQGRRPTGSLFNPPRGVYKHRNPPPADRRPRDFSTQEYIKVSLASDPKVVAGKIAHCSRSNRPPTVLAIGHGCLNQAIKSVAIARRFCMQPQTSSDVAFDLSCQPAFRDNGQPTARENPTAIPKPSLALYLAKRAPYTFKSASEVRLGPCSFAPCPQSTDSKCSSVRTGACRGWKCQWQAQLNLLLWLEH
ncbi:hypothetical protein ABBQ38_014725 [Trebouxia sp. C0009 RCD-2024]